ncbi:glycoside hydrolase family 16 protein [Bradyrhizobium sp. sBnM-33]|uniref:glycoside hydrolase family 16 protein n=1 Tax=Bradyrhizobium sp. sBnM-33 TaxID=2831780 RepID=UPI00293E054C|nr:glycoside hydrolase family 16 protein [Bradyrhizobium sp. sBnM-33]WOH53847.1 glycoside hydrolase family 16 protein [Bradyrhizobium sp. sBnM-33]
MSDGKAEVGFGHSSFVDPSSGYDPFKVEGGALTITATGDVTPSGIQGSMESGLITTEGDWSQKQGYFEMRADLSDAPHAWDAFWMLPDQQVNPGTPDAWQELDVVEHYGENDKGVYSHIHTTDPSNGIPWQQNRQVYSETANEDGYHTYGVLWEADKLSFYVDGELKGSQVTPSDYSNPQYLIANLATQAGAVGGEQMKIDYIRAYSKDGSNPTVALGQVSAPDGRDPGTYGATALDGSAPAPAVIAADDVPPAAPAVVAADDVPPAAPTVVAADDVPPAAPAVVAADDVPPAAPTVVAADDVPPAAPAVVAADDVSPAAPINGANTAAQAEVPAQALNARDVSFETMFNDATTTVEEGLRHHNVRVDSQSNGVEGSSVADLRLAQTGLSADVWADFIASGNVPGDRAEHLVATANAHGMGAFIRTLESWEQNNSNLDASPGRLFEARFNNELLGDDSTIGTLAAMINGHQRHDTALVTAAEEGFHANRADVSGNNVPLEGGTYFAHAHTISDPLSTITDLLPSAVGTRLTAASLAGAAVADVPPGVAGGMENAVAHAAPFGTDGRCAHHQHFEHMWG